MAEIDISMPGLAPALPVGSSARVSRHLGFPVPCCCCAGAPNFVAVAPKPVAAGAAAPNSPPAAGAAAAPNAPAGAGVSEEKRPPAAGAGAAAAGTPKPANPVEGAGAGAPNGLDAGLPKPVVVAAVVPKPPRLVAGVAAPKVVDGAAAAAPKAPVAGAAPKGEVDVVRPNADALGAAAPNAEAGAAAGAPNTLDFAPKALLVPPKPVVAVVLPNACGRKVGRDVRRGVSVVQGVRGLRGAQLEWW